MYSAGKGTKRNDTIARSYFESAAKLGDLNAKATLASWLCLGRGGEVDMVRAYSLNLSAAEHGLIISMYAVGVQYQNGQGVNKDPELALYWYTKAGDAGMFIALINAGNMYLLGADVSKDYDKALYYFKKGKDLGNEECKHLFEYTMDLLSKSNSSKSPS